MSKLWLMKFPTPSPHALTSLRDEPRATMAMLRPLGDLMSASRQVPKTLDHNSMHCSVVHTSPRLHFQRVHFQNVCGHVCDLGEISDHSATFSWPESASPQKTMQNRGTEAGFGIILTNSKVHSFESAVGDLYEKTISKNMK